MHIFSTDKQKAVVRQGGATEKHQQEIVDYIKQEESHLVFVEDALVDPTDSLKQMGHPYTSTEFETRLATILPSNCAFISNPWITDKKAVVRLKNFNEQETLCPYERGVIPEHSVMQLVTKEVPDNDIMSRRKSLNRADLPKYEYVPGQGFVFDDSVVRPGFKRIKQIGREIKRGWRTVLIRLIQQDIITLYDAERVFGSKDHLSWAQHTGKREHVLPW
jgi:hypothetical protein